jgi:2-dehydropantoate 2-reductase
VKILVYGAGGVGAFYGALLARGGHQVHFVARGPQLEALRERGLRITSFTLGEVTVPSLVATSSAAEASGVELALVCVKAHQTAAILDDLATVVGPDTLVVALQNGVEADGILAGRFGSHRVPAAVVYVGATVVAPGVVSHVANGLILLGAPRGFDPRRLEALQQALSVTGLPVRIAGDIREEQWRKLIWNASFNPVSALVERTPGEILATPPLKALVSGLMREVIAVARAQGIELSDREIDEQIGWTQANPAIRTSMEVDRQRGRALETEALVGVVIRRGRECGVPTPLSEQIYARLTAIGPET